jgi:hypothetical protein
MRTKYPCPSLENGTSPTRKSANKSTARFSGKYGDRKKLIVYKICVRKRLKEDTSREIEK